MTAYADFSYYSGEYLNGREAAVDAASFPYWARIASAKIKEYTHSNIDDSNIPDEVKLCCCDIAEKLYKADKSAAGKGLTSESSGRWSQSYESAETAKKALNQEIRSAVYMWLSDTGLLFAGVGS